MNKFLVLTLAFACVLPVFARDHAKKTIDPDDAYKNNCMRCHSAVRHYSPRVTATIVNHMRVRANMTEEETQAILEYLTESAPAKSTPVAAYGAR